MLLTNSEVADWCRKTEAVRLSFEPWPEPRLAKSAGRHVELEFGSETPPSIVGLARGFGWEAGLLGDMAPCGEAMLWIHETRLWGPEDDDVGWSLVSSLWSLPTEMETRPETVARVLRRSEPPALVVASIALPLLFQWDATLIRADGGFLADMSHDRYAALFAKTVQSVERIERDFRELGYAARLSPP